MNAAQFTRLQKEAHPERYCPKCLWNIERSGRCPRHMIMTREAKEAAEYDEASHGSGDFSAFNMPLE